jgi:peptidoglycan/xylan/chitin deacetylase (PgdA/CDA1 family)
MLARMILGITLAGLTLLLVTATVFLFRPNWIVAPLASLSPEVVYSIETSEPVVALTVDDGPDPETTERILDVLGRYAARATFFLISDHVAGNEDVVARTVREHHELANHLNTDHPSILLDPVDFEWQLVASHRALSQFANVRWFRPGSAWYSAGMLSVLRKHGYRCVLGSVYPFDPQLRSSWFAARYVLQHVRPGSILVLHDRGRRGERTVATLATILPELSRRGFRLITLSEMLDLSTLGR